ncbi:hypothetical protein [Jiangella endophytica]|uniref:hypothetical protein n=1 Tax=Jiangella endophytica TaxID=1623398 RepID=UPI000E344EB1|nr:hypothetical protein [Jiangella endophytica]
MTYVRDSEGNRLIDFSRAGYLADRLYPRPPGVIKVAPVAGDNTDHPQAAIDAARALPLDDHGWRGGSKRRGREVINEFA